MSKALQRYGLSVTAFVLLILALIVAAGASVFTKWNVYLCGALAVWVLDQIVNRRKETK
jgi:hypothetical protein